MGLRIFIRGLSPPLSNEELMPCQCSNGLREYKFLERPKVKSVKYNTESISLITLKKWEILPNEIKDSESFQAFRVKVKKNGFR